ncbi:restriction endonuclease fold toxin 5 domain-containing protein [Burkholderia pseudomallei]
MARAGAALLGGAATAGTASLPGDTSKDDSKAAPVARTLPRTDESCKKCPPEESGRAMRANHSMSPRSREYQGRITGRPYSVAEGWSEEWKWLGVDFDGFRAESCLLQETKGDYDQFLDDDGEPVFFFTGFDTMREQIWRQAIAVKAHPPAQLTWYFMTPHAREFVMSDLRRAGVPSVYQP